MGTAANNAAKMAALKYPYYSTYITSKIYDYLHEDNKKAAVGGHSMWTDLGTSDLGYRVYGSGFEYIKA